MDQEVEIESFNIRGMSREEFVFLDNLEAYLKPSQLLQFDPLKLVSPSYSELPIPTLNVNGYGLSEVLNYLAGNLPEILAKISDDLRSVTGFTGHVRTPRAEVIREGHDTIQINGENYLHTKKDTFWGHRFEVQVDGQGWVRGEFLSEGTVLVLGLLTVIHSPNAPQIVLLDDIDRALHPRAEKNLIHCLRKVLQQNPQLQIVTTTHSPYLLDFFEPEEVRVLALNDKGHTVCKSLTDHPEWPRLKDSMGTGEFWSLVGEDWTLGDFASVG